MTNEPPLIDELVGLLDEADAGVRRLSDLDDQIVVWIVGISAAALALIIGHFDEKVSIPPAVKAAAFLLGLCIVCGIGHRVIFRQFARRGHVSLLHAKITFRSQKMANDLIATYGDTPQLREALEKLVRDLGGNPTDATNNTPKNISKANVVASEWLFHICLLVFVVAGGLLIGSLVLSR